MLSLLIISLTLVLLGPLPQEATSLEHSDLEDGDTNELIQSDVRSNYEAKHGTGINYNTKDLLLLDERNKKLKHHKIMHKEVNKDRKPNLSKKSRKEKSQKIQSKAKKQKKTHKDKPKSNKKAKKRKNNKGKNIIANKQNLSERRKHKNSKIKGTNERKQYPNKLNKKDHKIFRIRENSKDKKINNKIITSVKITESKKDTRKSKAGGINILGENGKTRGVTRQAACSSEIDLTAGESIILFSSKDKGKIKCKTTINGPEGSTLSVSCPLFNLYESKRCKVESLKLRKLPGYKGKLCGSQAVSGTTQSNRLRILYKRKKLRKKQCSAGFICTITAEGGTPIPSISLDRTCDASATTLQPGEEILIFPDLGFDVRSPFFCEHTIQGPAESGLSLICPAISLIKGCFKEIITVTDANGFGKEFYCDQNIEYSASGGSMLFSYDKSKTRKKDCPGKFLCLVTVEVNPTITPSVKPPVVPTVTPSIKPPVNPTDKPTVQPTIKPTIKPPVNPTVKPTVQPTIKPTIKPTVNPTDKPTVQPTIKPTIKPTVNPTDKPTVQPTIKPTIKPTVNPTDKPTVQPTSKPTIKPTVNPTDKPTVQPTIKPTIKPTVNPTDKPTVAPTEKPNPSTGTRPYCENCGTSSISVARGVNGNRIVGGQQATKGEYPWQVYLGIFIGSSQFACGGSIIKKSWILSAAHCFIGHGTISKLEIHLGAHDLQDVTDSNVQIVVFNQQDVTARVKAHPDYDIDTVQNDIALIELKEDLVFTSRIQPVCLADLSDFAAGKQSVATGWGLTEHGGSTSNILLEVGLETIDLATCQDLYQKTPTTYTIFDTMICTLTTGKDTCSGDSGGPLVAQLDNGKWVQIGITSFGFQCAFLNAPGVWTHVAKYKTWIDQTTGSDQC